MIKILHEDNNDEYMGFDDYLYIIIVYDKYGRYRYEEGSLQRALDFYLNELEKAHRTNNKIPQLKRTSMVTNDNKLETLIVSENGNLVTTRNGDILLKK